MGNKFMRIALMYAMVAGGSLSGTKQTSNKQFMYRKKIKTDWVIELLVTTGICKINNEEFEIFKDSLPNKLRGTVLFHSCIDTKQIFITYTRI